MTPSAPTHRRISRSLKIICATATMLLASQAHAQFGSPGGAPADRQAQQNAPGATSGGLRPPVPQRPDDPPRWIYYLTVAAMGAAAIGVSVLPSKRGHQD